MNSRDAVVFLHAFPLHAGMWEAQRAAIGDAHPTLAPHLPGFGGRPAGPQDLDSLAAGVLAELDAEGIESAVLVGLSMGGYLAFRMLAAAPGRFHALVLADTRANPDDEPGRGRRTDLAQRVLKEGTGFLAEAMLPALLGDTTRRERPQVAERVRAIIDEASPEGVANAALAMRDRPDSTPLLESLRIPTLVLVGDEDALTPPQAARDIADRIPGATLRILPGAGHLSSLETPLVFNDALLRFLAEVQPAG